MELFEDSYDYLEDDGDEFDEDLLDEIESIPETELKKIIQEFDEEDQEEPEILEDKINIQMKDYSNTLSEIESLKNIILEDLFRDDTEIEKKLEFIEGNNLLDYGDWIDEMPLSLNKLIEYDGGDRWEKRESLSFLNIYERFVKWDAEYSAQQRREILLDIWNYVKETKTIGTVLDW